MDWSGGGGEVGWGGGRWKGGRVVGRGWGGGGMTFSDFGCSKYHTFLIIKGGGLDLYSPRTRSIKRANF